MKRLFTYIATLLLFAACTSEETVIENMTPDNVVRITAEIEDPKGIGDEFVSRASLIYDDDTDVMEFKWGESDVIGVFTYTEHAQQQKFEQIKDDANTDHLRTFKTQDGYLQVDPRQHYVAYMPYLASSTDYTKIPIDYTGQRQMKPVNFSNYWNDKTDKDYKDSQSDASSHLVGYDFQCSGITIPSNNGGIRFCMERMGAIVRFWIVVKPEFNYVYDELQLVNRTKLFTTKALMNVEKQFLTFTEQSHIVNLKLGKDGEGFDMTEQSNDGNKSTTPFYDWYNGKYTGYLMVYMMLGPINLTGDDVENCFIYLVAHEKADHEKKHYFKSSGLSKPNLTPNAFYKWNVYPNEDTPIEVSEITVEEWREGTTFDNGNNGNGTATW